MRRDAIGIQPAAKKVRKPKSRAAVGVKPAAKKMTKKPRKLIPLEPLLDYERHEFVSRLRVMVEDHRYCADDDREVLTRLIVDSLLYLRGPHFEFARIYRDLETVDGLFHVLNDNVFPSTVEPAAVELLVTLRAAMDEINGPEVRLSLDRVNDIEWRCAVLEHLLIAVTQRKVNQKFGMKNSPKMEERGKKNADLQNKIFNDYREMEEKHGRWYMGPLQSRVVRKYGKSFTRQRLNQIIRKAKST